jgi:predicted nuclease of predicted toxin-antitoxin system
VETYEPFEDLARQRIGRRDEDDWPVLAAALALDCPIWTEDTDFFGCGVATWTSDRIELYLANVSERTNCDRCPVASESGNSLNIPMRAVAEPDR